MLVIKEENNKPKEQEDADGNEISLEQMVEKYFSDPETCFIGAFKRHQLAETSKRTPINNIFYFRQVILDQQKKFFLSNAVSTRILTDLDKNSVEDSSINTDASTPKWSKAS